MNLTVQNITDGVITVTQIVPSGQTPLCFTVNAGSSLCVLVDLNSAWTVTDAAGKVLYASLAPQQAQYTAIIDDYTPAPVLTCGKKAIPDAYFFALAGAFFAVAVVGYFSLRAQWVPTPDYQQCLTMSAPSLCESIHPQSRPHKVFFYMGLLLSVVVMVGWFLFKGPLGKWIAGEPKYTINCQDCLARGDGWQFTEPSANDGVSGFKLWLRKMRCRFGQSAGPCMCFNAQDRQTCEYAAYSPGAPSGLTWQADIANTDMNKANPPGPISPGAPPPIKGDVCACCTDTKGTQCFDVRSVNPLNTPCTPFAPHSSRRRS